MFSTFTKAIIKFFFTHMKKSKVLIKLDFITLYVLFYFYIGIMRCVICNRRELLKDAYKVFIQGYNHEFH